MPGFLKKTLSKHQGDNFVFVCKMIRRYHCSVTNDDIILKVNCVQNHYCRGI